MLAPEDLNKLLEQILLQVGQQIDYPNQKTPSQCPPKKSPVGDKGGDISDLKTNLPKLTPQKILVIIGLLGGTLEVQSVLVDRDQVVNILLTGSLRRKTKLEKMLDEIGQMPFDDVLKAVLGRVT